MLTIKLKKNDNQVFDLNKFLRDIKLKKQYFKMLKYKCFLLDKIKKNNYKYLNLFTVNNGEHLLSNLNNDFLITYIIDICFLRSNTFIHIMDFSGKIKFFYSSGSFQHSGKSKRVRYIVLKDFYKVLQSKLKFLKGKPIALHLKNVGHNKKSIVKKLKKKFFIKCIKNFSLYPYNGCRKKKRRNG